MIVEACALTLPVPGPRLLLMKSLARLWLILFVGIFAACATFQVAGQVQRGRSALAAQNPEAALAFFLEASKSDPQYVYNYQGFREGVWTYLGRAQYTVKRYGEARQSLERALAADKTDLLARLYLGLTLLRINDYDAGVREITAALRAIHDWLEYINAARRFDPRWDPLREMRGAIEKALAEKTASETSASQWIALGEWLGERLEREVEAVREDEQRRFDRDFDRRRDGGGFGIGIGF